MCLKYVCVNCALRRPCKDVANMTREPAETCTQHALVHAQTLHHHGSRGPRPTTYPLIVIPYWWHSNQASQCITLRVRRVETFFDRAIENVSLLARGSFMGVVVSALYRASTCRFLRVPLRPRGATLCQQSQRYGSFFDDACTKGVSASVLPCGGATACFLPSEKVGDGTACVCPCSI